MTDREEILKALQVIKSTCKQYDNCDRCPLSKNGTCVLLEQPPENWKIVNKEPIWRAFEE